MSTSKKILVTGASGFIGGHLLEEMDRRAIEYICLCRNKQSLETYVSNEKIVEWKNPDGVFRLIEILNQNGIRGVIHLASRYITAHAPKDIPDLFESNLLYGGQLLEALCQIKESHWFLNIGTFWQHYNNEPYTPVNLYAATKQAFETIAKYYIETNDLYFITLKLADTFGFNDKRRKIFSLWKDSIETGVPLRMSGGEQFVDVSPVENVVDGILYLVTLLQERSELLSVGNSYFLQSGNAMPLKRLSSLVEKVIGRTLPIVWGAQPYKQREIFNEIHGNPSIPGWHPKKSLNEAILNYFCGETQC